MSTESIWVYLLSKIHTLPIVPEKIKKLTINNLPSWDFPYPFADFIYKDETYKVTQKDLSCLADLAIEYVLDGNISKVALDLFTSSVPDLMVQTQAYLEFESERIEAVLDCDIYTIETEGDNPEVYYMAVWPPQGG